MTYEKFLEELKSLGFSVPEVPPQQKRKKGEYYGYDRAYYSGIELWGESRCAPPWEQEPALILSWTTGGTSGGSCWGDDPRPFTSDEPEPNWDDLDRILEHFCPNITYIRYKGVMRVAKTGTWTRNEYYGNSTNYAIRAMPIKALWEHMNQSRLFENDNE